jgi:hypothetical protein
MHTKKPSYARGISDEGIELTESTTATRCAAPPKIEDWQLRQRSRQLGRELRRPTFAPSPSFPQIHDTSRRFDPPRDLFDEPPVAVTPTVLPVARRDTGRQVLSWLIVIVGAGALSGGVGLIAWSLSTARSEFWNLALGLTLGGQGTLILGLLVIVSRLWRNSRYASGKLQDVYVRLGELQRTAEALSANRGGAPAFYADLARGAPPQMLLANLKGQIDQLARRFGGGI